MTQKERRAKRVITAQQVKRPKKSIKIRENAFRDYIHGMPILYSKPIIHQANTYIHITMFFFSKPPHARAGACNTRYFTLWYSTSLIHAVNNNKCYMYRHYSLIQLRHDGCRIYRTLSEFLANDSSLWYNAIYFIHTYNKTRIIAIIFQNSSYCSKIFRNKGKKK